jgi:hypothetical protein
MNASLRDFVTRTLEHKRIRFGDLRRLQRDVLPARLTMREQAEVLIALDKSVHKADRAWSAYLIATVRDFAVWGLPPPGRIDRNKAEWLIAALSSGGPTARLIAREVVREAHHVDEGLLAFARPRTSLPSRSKPDRTLAEREVNASGIKAARPLSAARLGQ